ncbi:MAG: four helix bundle protein [Roseibacillus sp.]
MAKGTQYELEERTYQFAVSVRRVLSEQDLPPVCWEDSKQLLRSSGSVGANYIEANDSLSQRDKIYRMRVARKEAAESRHWARLLSQTLPASLRNDMATIEDEADQLARILTTIVKKLPPAE